MVKRFSTFILLLVIGILLSQNLFGQTYYTYTDTNGIRWVYTLNGNNATIERERYSPGIPNQYSGWSDSDGAHIGIITGIIRVPATVNDGVNTYPVTRIGDLALMGNGAKGITFESTTNLTKMERRVFQSFSETNLMFIDMAAVTSEVSYYYNAYENGEKIGRGYFDGTFYCIPASTLIYLPNGTSKALLDEEGAYNIMASGDSLTDVNFIFDGICSKFKVYDQNLSDKLDRWGGSLMAYTVNTHSVYVPHAFTAKEASYDREFINVSGKAVSTLYLPYPTDLPDGMQAYEFVRKVIDWGGDKAFYFKPVPLGTRLEANHPYLICITDGQNHTLPVMQNVEVPVTPILSSTATTSDDGDWSFNGTTETIANAEAVAMNAYYLSGNRWWAIQNGVANDYIGAFRCFMSSPTGAVPAKSFFMVLDDEDATTKIKELEENTEADLKSGKHVFYSIDGKRIGTDYDALESGQIYIVNGKKFYKL